MGLETFFSVFFTSLWNWKNDILYNILLFFDGLIYDLVSYIYKLFLLVCRLNFNSLESIISPLVDRVKAVILVFIVFKVGVMLIQLMIKQDDATKASSSLIKNIFVVGIMLVSYNLVFNILNEFSMLIVGVPDGYSFTTLSRIAGVTDTNDKGLINRFVFGNDTEVNDIGDFIAFETLSMFIRDAKDESQSTFLKKTIEDGDGYNFMKTSNINNDVGKDVVYTPVISGIMGLFIIYCIGSVTLDVGVRMFKLIVLQLIAPVAIITKIDENSDIFKKYISTYFEVYTSAFFRILSVLIMNVFISKFILNIGEFFGSALEDGDGIITKIFLTIIIIVSGYMFVIKLPEFLKQITGKDFSGKEGKNFANAVGTVLGATGGAVLGAIGGGYAVGKKGYNAGKDKGRFWGGVGAVGGGLGGVLGGAALGAASGAVGGFKGNTIADKIKNVTKGTNYRESFNGAVGTALNAVGVTDAQDAKMGRFDNVSKALEAYENAQIDAIKDNTAGSSASASFSVPGAGNVKFGDNKSAYAEKMLQYNSSYVTAQASLESAKRSNDESAISTAMQNLTVARDTAIKEAETLYDSAKNSASNKTISIRHQSLKSAAKTAGVDISYADKTTVDIKGTKTNISGAKTNLSNKNSYRRTH